VYSGIPNKYIRKFGGLGAGNSKIVYAADNRYVFRAKTVSCSGNVKPDGGPMMSSLICSLLALFAIAWVLRINSNDLKAFERELKDESMETSDDSP
jgi:hypothetical protein